VVGPGGYRLLDQIGGVNLHVPNSGDVLWSDQRLYVAGAHEGVHRTGMHLKEGTYDLTKMEE
jgi:hypothetical protein